MKERKIKWTQLLERESARIEWKEKVYNEEYIVQTLCAFANDIQQVGGGRVICGIKEKTNESGQSIPIPIGLDNKQFKKLRERVLSICRDNVEPPLTPMVADYPMENTPSHRILIFEVVSSPYAHRYKTKDKSVHYYVRINDRTQRADGLIPRLLELKNVWPPFLDQSCQEASIKEIDLMAVKQFLGRINLPLPVEEYLEPGAHIRGDILDMVTMPPGVREGKVPRNFTIILFGNEPHRFFRGAFAIFSVYLGKNRNAPHSQRNELFGPVPQLVKELMSRLQLYMGIEIDKEADFLSGNQNRHRYSHDAVREAIVNAFVHRDYHSHEPVRVTVFNDHLEVTSPGGLHADIDVARFQEGKSPPYWRNPSLTWFMVELGFAQNEGKGILMIINETKKIAGKEPEFDTSSNWVVVSIPAYQPESVVPLGSTVSKREGGVSFETRIAEIYRMMGFEVKLNQLISGRQVDLELRQKLGGMIIPFIVECKVGQVDMEILDSFIGLLSIVKREDPRYLGIIVSNTGFSSQASAAADASGVLCILYSDLVRSMIDFTHYIKYLVDDFKNSELSRMFIEPRLRQENKEKNQKAGEVLEKWLAHPDARQIILLGDYGTGKTTLARKLAHDLGKRYLEDPTQPVPVLVNLRQARYSLGLEQLVIYHLQSYGMDRVSFNAFRHLLEQGFIVLIFDGFDEMVTRTNARLTLENLRELNRAVTGKAKVMLTCRTHYFRDHEEEKRLIGGDHTPGLSEGATALYREISNRPDFKIVYLQEFTESQVKQYFNNIFGETGPVNYDKMKEIYDLEKLSRHPVLLDMIVKSLGRLANDKMTLRSADLYDAYTRLWIDRNDWRNVLTPEEKMIFVEELALLLWDVEKESIHYRELNALLKGHVKETIRESMELEFADYEVRTATFLQRDQEGNYRFSYHSFLEFFLAKRIVRQFEEQGIACFDHKLLSPGILGFLTDLIIDRKEPWINASQSLLTRKYIAKTSENTFLFLVTLLRKINPAKPVVMEKGIHLPGARLMGVDLEAIVLHHANLRGADLSGASLRRSDLSHTDLTDAVLKSADLSDVKLDSAILTGTILSSSKSMIGAD